MILVNGHKISDKTFPDGTSCIMFGPKHPENGGLHFDDIVNDLPVNETYPVNVTWRYENGAELERLMYIVFHIQEMYPEKKIELFMPYVPNARMDRVHNTDEVFTLKYFAKIINWLAVSKVIVLDPHSDVSAALIDRIQVLRPDLDYTAPTSIMHNVIECIKNDKGVEAVEPIYYFPDAGSLKRYKDLLGDSNVTILYGEKLRDFTTGNILGLDVKCSMVPAFDSRAAEVLAGHPVVMIDDIVSYGGTFAHSADKLKALGAEDIYAFVTHAENSVTVEGGALRQRLDDGTVTRLFTTDSLYTGEHPSIEVIHHLLHML